MDQQTEKRFQNIAKSKTFKNIVQTSHSPAIDHLFDAVYPHYYAVTSLDPNFEYSGKRMKELGGYNTK